MLKIIFILSLVVLKIQSCPTKCSCFMEIVDCANREFEDFPTNIPTDSVELFLQGNNIKELKVSDFTGLSNLQYVYLQNNAIASIETGTFDVPASNLITLDLHGNQIGDLRAGLFDGMSSLKVLNLNQNQIAEIKTGMFADLVVATQISFYDNLVETLSTDMFGDISALWYLGVANNKLKSIPDNFGSQFTELYSIDYSGNLLETLPVIPSNSTQLYFNNNKIPKIPVGALNGATELYEVFLADNLISEIDDQSFQGADKLRWLDLSNNQITAVDNNMFMYATFEGLYLTGNDLQSVSNNAFASSKSTMTRLRLDDNLLTDLDPVVMSQLTNNNLRVWLGNNPWSCDCDLQDLDTYISDNPEKIYDENLMMCADTMDLVSDVNFVALCSSVIGDDNLALIISLPIVGAILLFLVISFIVFTGGKKNASKLSIVAMDNDSHPYEEIKINSSQKNPAYDYDTGF